MTKSVFLVFLLGLFSINLNAQASAELNKGTSEAISVVDNAVNFIQPRFPGCEEREIPGKYKYLCSQKRFVSYLERIIKYPKSAKAKGIQGKVIVSFIVEVDGTVSNAIVERSPNEELGTTCLRAINLINKEEYIWQPAQIDGENVRSKVVMPIDFAISYKSIKSKKPFNYINIPDIMASHQVDANGIAMTKEDVVMDEDKIYDDVEKSPQFRGCGDDEMSLIDRYKCSRQAYFAYVKEAIQYPELALKDRIQGIAKIECVIEKDGSVTNPRLLRDPGAGLGEEAMRIITQLKDSIGLWTPGEIGGEPVRTKTQLPLRFVLDVEDVNPLLVIIDDKKQVLHDCIRIEDVSVLDQIEGASVKEVSSNKASIEYGEKGRYGVYQLRLPKGKGKLPAALRKQEEVEAFEMYFTGLQIDKLDNKSVELYFDLLKIDATIVISNITGRTIQTMDLSAGADISQQLDLSDSRGNLFLISILQKDLVHTLIIHL